MEPLRCKFCNGNLIADDSGEFAKCEFCGTKYLKSAIQQKIQEVRRTVSIDGPVDIFHGDAELRRLLSNIKTNVLAGKIGLAMGQYRGLAHDYSSNPVVWEEWLNTVYQAFPTYSIEQGLYQTMSLTLRDIKEVYNYALITAKTQSDKDRISSNWSNYWTCISRKIIDGSCYIVGKDTAYDETKVVRHSIKSYAVTNGRVFTDFLDFHRLEPEETWNTLKSLHPSVAAVIDEGINRISPFYDNGIDFGRLTGFETSESWWPIYKDQVMRICFVTDKYLVYGYGDGEGGSYFGVMVLNDENRFDSSFLAYAKSEAKMNHKTNVVCPYCWSRSLKRTILGKQCKYCKRTLRLEKPL